MPSALAKPYCHKVSHGVTQELQDFAREPFWWFSKFKKRPFEHEVQFDFLVPYLNAHGIEALPGEQPDPRLPIATAQITVATAKKLVRDPVFPETSCMIFVRLVTTKTTSGV